jgi:hypothetical protein
VSRGIDERNNRKRNPLIVRDLNNPNTLWVNFANPSEPHEEVIAYIKEQGQSRSRSAHPSNQPKEPE